VPRWIDVTLPMDECLAPWPGDPPFRREVLASPQRGDVATVSALSMSAHAGTHLDAPSHFVARGQTVDEAPAEVLMGPARVLDLTGRVAVDEADLLALDPRPGERLLLRTDNSRGGAPGRPWDPSQVALTPAAARLLARRRVALVGIDSLSVGREADGVETHVVLLGAGIWVLEGLDLGAVAPGPVEMVALPLRIVGGDAAPCRVMVRAVPGPPSNAGA
jgi:arylformamidase